MVTMGPGFDDPHFDSDVAMNSAVSYGLGIQILAWDGLGWNGMVTRTNQQSFAISLGPAIPHVILQIESGSFENCDSFHYSNLISLDVEFSPVLARNGFEASHVPKAVFIMLLYACEDFVFFISYSGHVPEFDPTQL